MSLEAPLKKRIFLLDILRGIAILLVLFNHHNVVPTIHRGGWIGVSLFFVLSGYLVSGILFKEMVRFKNINIKLFYIRRGLRIYPQFYFFIAVTVLTLLALYGLTGHRAERLNWQSVLIELVFVQNYFHGLWYHTWSIAVEEHFYLTLPIFLKLFTVKRLEKPFLFEATIAFAIFVLFVVRISIAHHQTQYDIFKNVFATHVRIDGLLFGVLISHNEVFRRGTWKKWVTKYQFPLLALAVLLLVPFFIFSMEDPFSYTLGFLLLSIAFSIILLWCIGKKDWQTENLLLRFIALIGLYSYAIYLWQGYMISFVLRFFEEQFQLQSDGMISFTLFLLTSFVAGYLFTKFPENLVLRYRQKFFPERTALK